ncbi:MULTISPECIES: hypothetical protein [unclassified Streptomyces]|uniref:hypothetical protein n=1 Tax=unclassified Streptomyces TaxID=2593676 RepID=UPI00278C5DC5|nr:MULTISPECIES: hypothetical protein [unclassified Streptomyces]
MSTPKTVYVIGDPARLEMAEVLLGHARELVDEAGPAELRHLVAELTCALADTLRVAVRGRELREVSGPHECSRPREQ